MKIIFSDLISIQSWEKLKVSPWFDKQKPKPVYGKVDRSPRTVPLYKSDLVEREGEYEYEEFSRNCTENSIQAYKGKIHSYQV